MRRFFKGGSKRTSSDIDWDIALRQVEAILQDRDEYQNLVSQGGELAQSLLDVLQLLSTSPKTSPQLRSTILKAVLRLSRRSNFYPQCLTIRNVKQLGEHAVASGGFGEIWKGTVEGSHEVVCLKVVKVYQSSDIDKVLNSFVQEAIVWRQLEHPNLLPFLGLFFLGANKQRLCLISPWIENGNLIQFLERTPRANVNHQQLVWDVAEGLHYLHQMKIVHADLKGANILIRKSGRATVADFGLSYVAEGEVMRMTSSSAFYGGTPRWLAPELLKHESKPTYKTDIYAFSCVCYEIYTGLRPFHGLRSDAAVILEVMCGNRPSRPINVSELDDDIWTLMNQCWDADALSRPDTDKIKHYLWSLFGPIESPPPWNLTISKHIWVNVRGTDMPSDRQVAAFLSQSYERLEIRRHQLLSPEQGLCTSTLSQARTPQQQPSLSISPWTQGNLLYDPVAASSMATLPPPEGTDAPTGTEESFGSLDSASLPVSFSSPYDGTSRGVNRSGSDDTTLGSADSHSPMMYDQSSLLPGYHQHPPPTITSSKAPVDDNASGYQTQVHRDERSARNRAIHIRRLFELCQVGIGHASLLADVLLTTTPEEVVNGSQPLVVEFREKCLSNMKLITAQMPWTIASAERSRREKDALQKQASTGEGANEDFDEQTTEEKLLTGLLEANVQLTRTIKQYNDLGTEVLERKVEEEGERDVGMDKNAIDGIDQRPSSSDGSSGATPLLNATGSRLSNHEHSGAPPNIDVEIESPLFNFCWRA